MLMAAATVNIPAIVMVGLIIRRVASEADEGIERWADA